MKYLRLLLSTALTLTSLTAAAVPDQPLAFDPKVRTGKLDNGLTYYVRENQKPDNRLELRMAIKAGSVLEEDDQQGLAHFCEHMAFNGTEHFDKHELVDYLESIGMSFGADLNAYTSFDETVYMLQLPTDDAETVENGFQIIGDWAGGVTFADEEIEKERGVVIEEWRLRRGARQRIRDKQFPILFKDSLYADRLPIGKKDLLETFSPERLRTLYQTWYRPDLMTVIAVGDMPADEMIAMIKKHLGGLKTATDAPERPDIEVPDHDEILVSVETDPEATATSVSVYYKREIEPLKTVGDYRRIMVESLFNRMLNQRLDELRRQADPPFLSAYSHKGSLVQAKGIYTLGAGVKDEGVERGLEAVLTEAERVRRFGFTASEFERMKTEMQRWIQKVYAERENTESKVYASSYLEDFLRDTVSPGIESELKLYDQYMSGITLEEVNQLGREWMTEKNRVILVSGPERDDVTMPSEDALLAVFDRVASASLEPYVDDTAGVALLEQEPEPGSIVKRGHIKDLDVHVWDLSNGARVFLKTTDFKKDQIVMGAFSPGGHSLVDDDVFIPGSSAQRVISESGLGAFSLVQLEKKLSGKIASAGVFITELQEGLSGSCSPDDLETMMQLLHLRFTAPRADAEAFESYRVRTRARLKNRLAKPEAVFGDKVQVAMSQNHLRRQPWMPETVDAMDLEESLSIYKERFANAGDFTFFLVGYFDLAAMEKQVTKYIASLPGQDTEEEWVDHNIDPPDGAVEEVVREGKDAKSRQVIIFSGTMEWDVLERYHLQSMLTVLNIRLREAIREDIGGTYSIGARPSMNHFPEPRYQIYVSFGCAPDQVSTLVEAVFTEIEKIKTELVDDIYLTKVKQGQLRQRETNLERNEFWLGSLTFYEWNGDDPLDLLAFEDRVNSLTKEDVRDAAVKYFNTENVAKFTLLPVEEPSN